MLTGTSDESRTLSYDALDDCYHRLFVAIFLRAVVDYKSNAYDISPRDKASARTYLLRDDIYDALGLNMTGEECLDILDNKEWKSLETLFTTK